MKKFVDYDQLCEIPAKMREQAEENFKNDPKAYALAKRDELLMSWMTILPWRARHVRQTTIGSRENGANLFKDGIAASEAIARPGWVDEALKRNPGEKFWQYRFPEVETKVHTRSMACCRDNWFPCWKNTWLIIVLFSSQRTILGTSC